MLSGFPFRMVGQVQRAYSQFLDLINQEMRTPHPQQPDIPMAADPRLDLTPFLYRTLESLQKEVTYAGRYRNADPIGTPTISDPTSQLRGTGTNSSTAASGGDNSTVGSSTTGSGGTSTTSASPDGYNTSPIQPYTVKPPGQPISGAPAENPYKDAFNRVVGLLSSPVQLPFLGQQSPATQEYGQANYSSPQAPSYNNQGQQISQPLNGSNQAYSNNSSQTSQAISDQQLLANGVSPESLEVINHFGADAPAVLNNYAVQSRRCFSNNKQSVTGSCWIIKRNSEEHKAYEQILTDPDVLADYTCEFFGPNGPYPVEEDPAGQVVGNQGITPQQQAAALQQQQAAAQARSDRFARPQMPVPPQPQAPENTGDFWNNFGTLTDKDPANAWRYLNQAQQTPDIFRNKMLVME